VGLFDKMFGTGAGVAEAQPNTQERFEQLKQKYASVLHLIEQNQGVSLKNLHVQDGKLFIKGTVPSEHVKNQIWDQVKLVDPTYSDFEADLVAEPGSEHQGSSAPHYPGGAQKPGGQTYTVVAGDSLSKIARHFYGDATKYMAIFNANLDKLSDPNLIKPGQVLTIPPQ